MNVAIRERPVPSAETVSKPAIADADIHPYPKGDALHRFLEPRWRRHIETYGKRQRQGYLEGPAYPKGQPDAARRDAYPPDGSKPGSDLAFMRAQHLDPNNVALGILNPLRTGQGMQNLDLAAALCRATNEWQVAEWTSREPRLKASVVVPYEDAAASVAEIDRWAGHADFAQVLLLSRSAEPLGQRRYWPIYEAAARANLPIGIHAFGYGGDPLTGGGWPSYYIEEMVGHAQCSQALLVSMVVEGVFEQFRTLRAVLIESGFAWLPALTWRLDKHWKTLRSETPHLKRLPSEYIREHVWLTTQPVEEPQPRRHLRDVVDWIGWDRLLFATDYPHWDFDDPARAFPLHMEPDQRQSLFLDNSRAVYGKA